MKKFLLLFFIVIVITIYCINGEFNALGATCYDDVFANICANFSIKGAGVQKEKAVYSFAGTQEDITPLINKLDIVIVDTQELANVVVYYGYSPRYGSCLDYKGSKYNVQITYSYGTITVGLPVLVGSY